MTLKVCHLSSAHQGLDVRIFHKQCVALASAGYDTHLVIRANQQEVDTAAKKNVQIHTLDAPKSRSERMIKQAWRCYRLGRAIDADIYQFHDPELIPYGVLLCAAGKTVIYDVHEDLPVDILSKAWLPSPLRRLASWAAGKIEHFAACHFFSIVTATPFIANRFRRANPLALDINNFPLQADFPAAEGAIRRPEVCYIGTIGEVRGIVEIVKAIGLAKSNARLALYGDFREPRLARQLRTTSDWEHVDEYGYVDRNGITQALSKASAGLVTLHPLKNYLDALPVKMFEYMAAGIPVISSNFPVWQEIIDDADCGICVDPLKPQEIAEAIDFLVTNPERASEMGRNGRSAIEEKYNWEIEERKLIRFYQEIASLK